MMGGKVNYKKLGARTFFASKAMRQQLQPAGFSAFKLIFMAQATPNDETAPLFEFDPAMPAMGGGGILKRRRQRKAPVAGMARSYTGEKRACFAPKTSVERTRKGCWRGVRPGALVQHGIACADPQQRQTPRQGRLRVRSGLTFLPIVQNIMKPCIHRAFPIQTSGQARFFRFNHSPFIGFAGTCATARWPQSVRRCGTAAQQRRRDFAQVLFTRSPS